jgi:hypothetical protein
MGESLAQPAARAGPRLSAADRVGARLTPAVCA